MKDSRHNFEEYFKSLPVMINPQLDMDAFTAPKSVIYEGEANFVQDMDGENKIYIAEISIIKNWLDNSMAEFIITSPSLEITDAIENCRNLTIQTGRLESSGFHITRQKIGKENFVRGLIRNPIIRYYNEIDNKNIDLIYFHIFNFRQIIGGHAREHEKHVGGSSIRLLFSGHRFDIELYSALLSEDEWASVKENNYGLTYTGVVKRKDDFELSKLIVFKILNRFGQFLSFLNGSYCFPRGWIARNIKEEDLWINYTNYITDQYPKCNA